MSQSGTSKPWADEPFALLKYPENTEKTPCDFHTAATQMVNIHNIILRHLNSIYLQAPHIQPRDVPAFINYYKMWSHMLHHHHQTEEIDFFPVIEKQAGVPGLMSVNVEQHRTFDEGLQGMDEYMNDAKTLKNFDGKKLQGLIHDFGTVLQTHLCDEIPTLIGLRKYKGKVDIMGILKKIDEKILKEIKFKDFALAVTGHDNHWDGGKALIEDMPVFMRYVMGFIATYYSPTKFGPCTGLGNARPLYAFKKGWF